MLCDSKNWRETPSRGKKKTISVMLIDFVIHGQPYLTRLEMAPITTTTMPLLLPLHTGRQFTIFLFYFLSLRISFHVIGHRRPLSASVSISLTSTALFDGQTRLLFQVADQFWSCAQCRLHVHQCLGASFLTSERHARGFWCGLGGRYPLFKQGYLTRGAGWCWMFCAHVRQDLSGLERETPR